MRSDLMKEGAARLRQCLFSGQRVINFRPVFLYAVAAALSVFLFFTFGQAALWGALPLAAVCAAALCVCRKRGQKCIPALVFCAAFLLLYAGVGVVFCAERADYESAPRYASPCTVTGTVRELAFIDGGCRLTLDGLQIVDAEGLHAPRRGLYLYVYGGEEYAAGEKIRFSAEPEALDFLSYGEVNANAVLDGVKYRASASAETIERLGASFDLFGGVRDRMRSVLFAHMEEGRARVAYAMLTGDSGLIDEGMLDSFRYGGVAHVFAVSGLHIGVVYALLALPMRKLRVRAAVRLPVIAAVLFFYVGVCGFSPSSVRAMIMCLALSAADACGMKYDALNAVSLAALLVMLVDPVYFFQVGFRLSVAAAGGIIVTGGTLSRLLGRVRFLPKKVSSAVAVGLSAQLATFPLLLDAFGYVSALGLLLNLIFVPLVSAVYALLFAAASLSCLFPFAGSVLLFVPEKLLELVQLPVLAFDWKAGILCGFLFGAGSGLYFLTLFVLSDKIGLKPLPRAALAVFLAAVAVSVSFLSGGALTQAPLRMYARYGTDLLFFGEGKGRCLVLTGVPDPAYAERFFLQEGADELAAVFLVCDAQEADGALAVVHSFARIGCAYISADAGMTDAFRGIEVRECTGAFAAAGTQAEFVCAEGLLLYAGGMRVLVAGGGFDTSLYVGADLLIAEEYDAEVRAACTPSAEAYFAASPGKISVYAAGNLQIARKGDIIVCKGKVASHEVRIV